MASRPNFKGEASASSNIVCLPTAAPSKVNNFRYVEQRAAALAAREGNRWGSSREIAEARQRIGSITAKIADHCAGQLDPLRTRTHFAMLQWWIDRLETLQRAG